MTAPEPSRPSLFQFKRFFRTAASRRRAAPGMPEQRAGRAVALCHALLSERGEVSGARLAYEALGAYRTLDEKSLRLFFDLLVLQRIDWRTSALILEKLIQYEAVHEIRGWNDLHRRLGADRRCYAFFHPALPDEPLIFMEVALTRGMTESVQALLAPDAPMVDPRAADCAIFYSITSCQRGLRGVSFGNMLIKQVAEDLGREFPRVKTFATLSPIPGFQRWLGEAADEHAVLRPLVNKLDAAGWHDGAATGELKRDLLRLCASYLLHAKQGQEALDTVERFHLGNGARLERINWLGDTSPGGLARSAGMMVNYVYDLDEVERNHEAYARERRVVAARRIEALAKESLLARQERASLAPQRSGSNSS